MILLAEQLLGVERVLVYKIKLLDHEESQRHLDIVDLPQDPHNTFRKERRMYYLKVNDSYTPRRFSLPHFLFGQTKQ